ncbi:TonB-dependent receptor [Mucilaginibacter sabulilitoris]|uniref:TonB-dependent receptor n=1 Tax=Mucilaginibacter sabulilitoris TaxID=1173583 RepID=A0ABZ0TLQ4_9SPHI|nr:TonB-dependent receptor [Mucilaginibacter sabulilitoris]WPU94091.1 TonB-dependent receptor [Mucilaginibacter sabulilitoris]
MKIKQLHSYGYPISHYKKYLLMLKYVFIFTFLFCIRVSAYTYSQNVRVTMDVKKMELKKALSMLEKKSNTRFLYSEEMLPSAKEVTINVKDAPFADVLQELLKDTQLKYQIGENGLVIIAPKSTEIKDIRVKGTVVDEKGVPLAGVTVKQEGTKFGAITNANGEYELTVQSGAQLTFSYIGFNSQTVSVKGTADVETLNITLKVNASGKQLNEIIVVGYGTQSKRAVTGSIASVKYDNFKDRTNSNVTQSLAGELPGVSITQAQGAPGSTPIIKIRGTSSITAGTNPLYVVDGLPLENFNLNYINPQDIESIDVLKDASSTAIYGSRGANGVVIVTTKLGKAGQTNVNASYEYGVQDVTRRIDMMNAQQFIQYYVDAHNNAWVALGGGNQASDPNSVRSSAYKIPEDFTTNPAQFGNGTNWQDVMFRSAPLQNAQVSVSGGTDKTQFLFSVGYLNQDAVLDANYYKRLSLRSNIKHKISDHFTVGTNLSFTGIFDRTDGVAGKSDVVSLGLQSDPIFPVYTETGSLGFRDPNSTWYRFIPYSDLIEWHPYSLTREIEAKNKSFNTLATGFVEYKIIDGLKFRSSINANLYNNSYNSYANAGQGYGYSAVLPAQGVVRSNYSLNWLTENTLTYDKQFGDHSFNALIGYTAQHERDEYSQLVSSNFPNDLVHTLNAGTASSGTSTASEWAMVSYLARVNYNYKNRYFLTGTVRRDGSSRFGTSSKWGYFPSVSAGWLISDEDFMKNAEFVSNLKLRASYGVAGNNQIPNYGPVSLLTTSNYVSGSALASGLTVSNISNPDLKWEKTNQFNLGLDIGLIKNRVNFTAEFYNSITNNLLLNVPVPDITGFSTQLTNIGKVRNRGLEFSLNTKNTVGAFKWSTDFNLSFNRNKVLQLGPGNAPLLFTDYVVQVKTEVGQPVSNFYGYIFDGVYKNQAAIDGSPHVAGTTPGEPIVRDVNKDGKIDANDQTTIGNAQANFASGITNTFSYKGFEFSFMFQGSFGGQITNQLTRYLGIWNGGRNAYAGVANYWKSESDPGDGVHFKPSISPTAMEQSFSSYWVESATWVRLKNIRLSYTLPKSWLQHTPVKGARIYVNAENVHLFSKYKNFDPENTTYPSTVPSSTPSTGVPSGAFYGVDYGSYPVPRVITFGAKLDF